MASIRGILNIQSLNELTSEKRPRMHGTHAVRVSSACRRPA